MVLGAIIGVPLSRVPLTAVPQRTALSHAFGGLAAGLVGAAKFYLWHGEGGAELTPFRLIAIGAEVLLMAKNRVDGVYDADPNRDPTAKKFDHLTYMEALERQLKVMDSTALSLCMDNKLPIVIFDLTAHGNIVKVVKNPTQVGTLVGANETAWA